MKQHLANPSVHSFYYHCILLEPPLLQLTILGNRCPTLHQYWSFTVFDFSYLTRQGNILQMSSNPESKQFDRLTTRWFPSHGESPWRSSACTTSSSCCCQSRQVELLGASSMISCANSLKMDKFVGAGGIRYKGRNCAVAVVVVVILLWSCSVLPAAWAQDPAGL